MRALLVDPGTSAAPSVHTLLEERGWSTTHAASAEEAAQFASREEVALVVVRPRCCSPHDLATCRAVIHACSASDPYVLLLPPLEGSATGEWIAASEADDYVPPPAGPAEILIGLDVAEARIRGGLRTRRVEELKRSLRLQGAYLQELFESAPEGIAVVDERVNVVRINSEFTRLFGYRQEEILGKPLNTLILPEHVDDEAARLSRALRVEERVIVPETVRRHRDGSLVDVKVLVTPILMEDGAIGAYGIYRDIRQRKQQERAVRDSEARYRALFDQSPVGVFLTDPSLRITHCNERLSQIIGLPYQEIVGTPLRRTLRGGPLLPSLQDALAGRDTFYEGPYHFKGSKERLWISVRYAPLRDAEGLVVGGIGVLEDVTARRRADQQLRAQAAELERVNAALHERTLELEAAMQARSRLYAVLNHELRTPISAIMLYQELLLSGTMGEMAPDQHQALESSHTASRHLLDLVQDVLDLSRIDAGKVRVVPREVCLGTLLNDLLVTVRPLAQSYGSDIRIDHDGEAPELITDPQRVRQILLNFVSNAAKFGRGQPIVIRCRSAEGSVRLEVQDGGIGIARSELPRLFEDFVQIGAEQHTGGVGLGLAISRRLAEMLGGRLEVESELGDGSTFRLVLPIRPASTIRPAPEVHA